MTVRNPRRPQGRLVEPLDGERDAKGWPKAFWTLAGAAPDFDVGDRPGVLRSRRRRRAGPLPARHEHG